MIDPTWLQVQKTLRAQPEALYSRELLSALRSNAEPGAFGRRWVPATELLETYGTRLRMATTRGGPVDNYRALVDAFDVSPSEWRIGSLRSGRARYVVFASDDTPMRVCIFKSDQQCG